MAKTIEQAQAELEPLFATDRGLLNQQLASLPGQAEAEIQGLDARMNRAYGKILEGARARGVGFSGMPLSEQAEYNATEYAPAVARVKQSQIDRQTGIVGTLNSLARDQRTQAQGIVDNDLAREFQERQFQEQIRQFNQQQALARQQAAASQSPSAGSYLSALTGGGSGSSSQSAGSYGFRNGQNGASGFFFQDSRGNAISAAKYAQLTGTNMLQLIQKMASSGDRGAAAILGGPGIMQNNTYKKQFAWDV